MSIYSTNRSGYTTSTNEAYKYDCAEDIIYESEVNLHRIWECALACDFASIKAIREGVVLEADETDGNKTTSNDTAAKSGFWNKLAEFFKKLGQKIAALFRAFINKLAQAFASNKGLVARCKKLRDSGKFRSLDGAKFTYEKIDYKEAIASFKSSSEEIFAKIEKDAKKEDVEAARNKTNENIKSLLTGVDEEYIKKVTDSIIMYYDIVFNERPTKDTVYDDSRKGISKKLSSVTIKKTETLDSKGVDDLLNRVEDSPKTIKGINDLVKTYNRFIGEVEKECVKNAREENNKGNVKAIHTKAAELQKFINTSSSICIKIVKAGVKNDRAAIGRVLSYLNGNDKVANKTTAEDAGEAGVAEATIIDAIFEGNYALSKDEIAYANQLVALC